MKIDERFSPESLREKGVMKGFDYLVPERKVVLREIEQRFKKVTESFGFKEYDGPLLQPVEFYQVKSGDELLEHTYSFEDTDGSLLVLRPEMTPTVSYMIARDDSRLSFPLKWWSNPDIFRKEKPQKGRKRQFKQLNVDIFDRADSGRNRAFDEAEVISVAVNIFRSFGLTEDDVVIKINNRALVEKFFDLLLVTEENRKGLLALIDRVEKISDEEFRSELEKLVELKENQEKVVSWLRIKGFDGLANNPAFVSLVETAEYKEAKMLFDLFEAFGISGFCEFSPLVVRGLGYYTGTVFEAFDRKPELGFRRALMGGGRYDNLTKDLGGKIDVTGVGFGFGNVPLEEILELRKMEIKVDERKIDYYLMAQSEEHKLEAVKLATRLRDQGREVMVDDSMAKEKPEKLSRQLAKASEVGARFAMIIFPDEWKEGKVVVKDLAEGSQKIMDLKELG